jgi:hypothetical protein
MYSKSIFFWAAKLKKNGLAHKRKDVKIGAKSWQ